MATTKTDYDLRVISPDLFLSEEQRPNIHVIGSSRQGKSYFIEWLMREDINRGLGCCLLDPSAGGSTAYRLLAYCAEQHKQNVLFIEPADTYAPFKKVVGLNPFRYDKDGQNWPKLRQISVDTLMRAVRDLYSVRDPSEQSRIERYLPLVFAALYDAQCPLADAQVFTNRLYQAKRDEILGMTDPATRTDIREAYTSTLLYNNFQSTINRLLRFTRGPVGKMFSVSKGVNWMKVVRDHWAVIVRLDNLDTFDARLLGTYIIAELETAKARLNEAMDRNRDFKDRGAYPPFYLYADEAYLFASQSLKTILDVRQKMNFKVTLAHHYARQFDLDMYEAIKVNCDMTVQFYVRGRETRDDISSELYGGDIDPVDASYANSNLSKQHAVIKIGKDAPVRTRLPDVANPDVSKQELTDYIVALYHRGSEMHWYYDSDTITQAPDEPVHEPRGEEEPHQRTARTRTKATGKTSSTRRVPNAEDYTRKFKTAPGNVPGREQHAAENGSTERD